MVRLVRTGYSSQVRVDFESRRQSLIIIVMLSAALLLLASHSFALADGPPSDVFSPRTEAECEAIDLRKGSMKDVPPTDQKGVGDCYVHAAVGMVHGYFGQSGSAASKQLSPDFVMAQALSKGAVCPGESQGLP